jgi:uncharacterized membrane protein
LLRFALLVACAAAFVWLTALSMPDVVGSHFGASGTANGFMPRGTYIRFMLAVVVGLPALLVAVSHVAMGSRTRINLPNRDYWLAPERRAETVSYLRAHMVRFSVVLVVFLCYVHWLVVRANRVQPPHLSNPAMISGLVVLVLYALVWTRVLVRHFSNRPLGRSG